MNGFGEPTDLAAMQQRLVDLQLQNEQLRSNSSRQHHQQQQTNNMLLGQLNSNQNEEFDWDKIMQGVNNQTTPQQNSNEIVIDRKKLAEYTSKVVEKTRNLSLGIGIEAWNSTPIWTLKHDIREFFEKRQIL